MRLDRRARRARISTAKGPLELVGLVGHLRTDSRLRAWICCLTPLRDLSRAQEVNRREIQLGNRDQVIRIEPHAREIVHKR